MATAQQNRKIVKTYKGKSDLIVGIICFIIGIMIVRSGLAYTMWSLSYDKTGAGIVKFGIFLVIAGIICMIHYGAKAPKILYSDGTTEVLKKDQK